MIMERVQHPELDRYGTLTPGAVIPLDKIVGGGV